MPRNCYIGKKESEISIFKKLLEHIPEADFLFHGTVMDKLLPKKGVTLNKWNSKDYL